MVCRWILPHLDVGVRVYWNGKGRFLLPNGNTIPNIPSSFLRNFPHFPIDGQFILLDSNNNNNNDRDSTTTATTATTLASFSDCLGVLLGGSGDETEWKSIKFLAYDTVQVHLRYEERVQFLNRYFYTTAISTPNNDHYNNTIFVVQPTKYGGGEDEGEDEEGGELLKKVQQLNRDLLRTVLQQEKSVDIANTKMKSGSCYIKIPTSYYLEEDVFATIKVIIIIITSHCIYSRKKDGY